MLDYRLHINLYVTGITLGGLAEDTLGIIGLFRSIRLDKTRLG